MAGTGDGAGGMSIGNVTSRAVSAVRAAPVLFLGTSLILVALPSAVSRVMLRGGATMQNADNGLPMQLLGGLLATLVVWLFLYMAAQAMLLRATVAEIDGRPETFGAYAAAGVRAVVPLIVLAVLLSIAVWVGCLLFLVPGIMMAVMWSVAAPALVVEHTGVIGALGRSRRLTKGARWPIFGLVVVVFTVYFIAAAIVTLGTAASAGFGTEAMARATPTLASTILSIILQTVFVALWTAIQGALYVELRDWKDGPVGHGLAEIFA